MTDIPVWFCNTLSVIQARTGRTIVDDVAFLTYVAPITHTFIFRIVIVTYTPTIARMNMAVVV